jgi:uncharacterized iron-regulated membrane protein
MASIRRVLFWFHVATGLGAGAIVLIMSVTGVALTYEKQIVEWADRRAWSAPPPSGRTRLSPETLLARLHEARPEAAPITLTLRADPLAPVSVTIDGQAGLLLDPYSGRIIGPPPATVRAFFRFMTNSHRWLAMEGAGRVTGKAVTGAANLGFLFLVISGIYLWVPRIWNQVQFRNAAWFRAPLRGRARDFSWHNVIGIWSAVPLAVVIAGAVPISYPWASNLVYRIVGEASPPAAQGRSGPRADAAAADPTGLDAAYAAALERVPAWRTMALRVPAAQAPVAVTVDEGYGGQPQRRSTLTVSRAGAVERWERFGELSRGRRLRSWLRFVHTGEYYGLGGQTLAGLVSAGAVVLVWTGFSLAIRRLLAWQSRRRPDADAGTQKAA